MLTAIRLCQPFPVFAGIFVHLKPAGLFALQDPAQASQQIHYTALYNAAVGSYHHLADIFTEPFRFVANYI